MDEQGGDNGLVCPSSPISSALPPHLRKRLEKRNKENSHEVKVETATVAPAPMKAMPSSPSRCVRAAEQLNKKRQERRQDQDRRRQERGEADE